MANYTADVNAAALNGVADLFNNGFFRMLNAGRVELAKLTFGNPAFAQASVASPSIAQSTAIAPDTTVTAGDIALFELLTQTSGLCIDGTVGVGTGYDIQMASVTIPPTAASVSCPGGFTLTLQMAG